MRYKTKSSLVSQVWFNLIVTETLDIYNKDENIPGSPYLKSGVAKFHKDCLNKVGSDLNLCAAKRQQQLVNLYLDIKENGYRSSPPLLATFNKEGQLELFDGFHRSAVLNYLGLDIDINIETNWTGVRGQKGVDFPLVETLLKEHPAGKWLYQPVYDSRLKDFQVERRNSPKRLEHILKNLKGDTILEIGCSEGYFSRELAKRGYKVTAIDKSPGYIASCKYLATINGLKINYENARWQEYLKQDLWFDNILFLSVLHNDMKFMPVEEALKSLSVFREKTARIFLEVPNNERERDWSSAKYNFLCPESIQRIEKETDMRVKGQLEGRRPIYVLERKSDMQAITSKEWESHNEWEKSWWGDCKDTIDEQIKQETLAELMKLTQFAGIRRSFNIKGMTVLDIGGGPVSLLLRCYMFKRAVVLDPCTYPDWVMERYKIARIEYIKEKAEDAKFDERFDEAWIYNCLQHVQDPAKVIEMAKASAKKIRVAEVLEIRKREGHPQSLKKEILDQLFGREGLVEQRPNGLFYFGVFRYE